LDEPSDDDEAISLDDFLSLLATWRQRVLASTICEPHRETHRRNPMVPDQGRLALGAATRRSETWASVAGSPADSS
jgi:hypothetical protein